MAHGAPRKPPPPASDEQVVERVRAGDEAALRALYDRLLPHLRQQVRRALPAPLRRKVAESDVIQEAYLAVLKRLDDFEDRGEGSFRAWLHRIVEHRIRDARRRYFGTAKRDVGRERSAGGDRPPEAPSPDDRSPSEAAAGTELVQAMLEAVESLSESHRTVLTLVHFKGLSLADAAVVMNRTPDAVRKLYGRAIESLRDQMEGEAP